MSNRYSINIDNLPEQLPKEKLYVLLKKVKTGDSKARELVIVYNLRLVLFRLSKRFVYSSLDREDLLSAGSLGLLKAVDSYDISKGVEFTTYAIKCIDNAIINYLNANNKYINNLSIDDAIYYNKEGKEIKLVETLMDDEDIEEEYIEKEIYKILRQLIEELSERDRTLIKMTFGFYDDNLYSQKEIAAIMNIPQSTFSEIKNRSLKKIRTKLTNEVIECRHTK